MKKMFTLAFALLVAVSSTQALFGAKEVKANVTPSTRSDIPVWIGED